MPILIRTPASGLVRTEEEYLARRQTVIDASIAAIAIAGIGVGGAIGIGAIAGAGGISGILGSTGGVGGLITKGGALLGEFGGDDSINSFAEDVVSQSQGSPDDGETNGLLDYEETGDSSTYLDLWDNTEGY